MNQDTAWNVIRDRHPAVTEDQLTKSMDELFGFDDSAPADEMVNLIERDLRAKGLI